MHAIITLKLRVRTSGQNTTQGPLIHWTFSDWLCDLLSRAGAPAPRKVILMRPQFEWADNRLMDTIVLGVEQVVDFQPIIFDSDLQDPGLDSDDAEDDLGQWLQTDTATISEAPQNR